jgi:hypothetical protein
MTKCDYAGCPSEAAEAVPTLERPSPIPHDHPDYSPPRTTLHVCEEHVPQARLRAAALEVQVLLDPPT